MKQFSTNDYKVTLESPLYFHRIYSVLLYSFIDLYLLTVLTNPAQVNKTEKNTPYLSVSKMDIWTS